ncbi:type VII toxin-antitoxin system HepT family RNase toxin [Clostridium kluyveri]|uniref:DUF86 domain-containing protein n=1 Tax=Clostridium kluyveri TaxID=1534 RepID=A0A1L5F8C4_CLOKL|nr:DUF86 domain-containing protein [Clostridium kluyveri]APM39264.1 hypothetical protein BS101_11160 [Clostridium kluyveri]UZQ50572.1 DUF86 domain-containing protein [Clostridium kluyveri]
MVKREIVISRINQLNEYVNILKTIKKYDKETYIKDPLIYGAAERFLHLSIECILDIGNHVISDMGYRKPENNRDIFLVLYENNILDEKIKINLCNMASFRNILVHDYIKLDRELVYGIINNDLKDIEEFVKIIIEYV